MILMKISMILMTIFLMTGNIDDDISDDREYVTLDMEEENSGEDAGQETEEAETSAMEAEAE